MSENPLEFNEKDLVERPPDWKPGTPPAKGGGFLEGIRQVKEVLSMLNDPAIKDLLKTLNIRGLGGQAKGESAPPGAQLALSGPAPQVQMLMKLLMAQYGDITVAELLDRLRADLGERRLSSFGKE